MAKLKNQLSKKDKIDLNILLQEIPDYYRDFYITKENLRLFIKENEELLYDSLKKGDKILFQENEGVIFIHGWSDKSDRKYIKILAKNDELGDKLLKYIIWEIDCDLYAKVKKNNPIREILQKNSFIFAGDRGKEVLLCKKYSKQKGETNVIQHKD